MSSKGERRTSEGKSENIKVFVRIRPKSKKELSSKDPVSVNTVNGKKIAVVNGPAHKQSSTSYDFDGVFGPDASQEEVYNQCVRPFVPEILAGFSCVVFAYGQTGTGKTHTMQGCYGDNQSNRDGYGMIPRVSEELLTKLNSMDVEFSMQTSCIELYNEELKDLLSASGTQDKPIKIQDSGDARGEVLMNVEEVKVTNVSDIYTTLMKAMARRSTAHTGMNDRSSRSHALFSLKVQIKEIDPVTGDQRVKIGQLNLVDLAGSECSSDSRSRGKRAAEAKNINQSLVTLGRVITALVSKDGYIPYRDSKLTRLLKESLGGKARTCIIATVSPCRTQAKESKNTLNYAQNAKEIRNRPVQNCQLSHANMVKNLQVEITSLKRKLKLQYSKNGVVIEKAEYDTMQQQMRALRSQVESQSAALAQAKQQIEDMKNANRAERDGVRETWEAVIGSNAEISRRVSGDADGDSIAPPTLTSMAAALKAAQEQVQAAQAARDEAIAEKDAANESAQSMQAQAGSKGTLISSLEDQTSILSKKNARLQASVIDLSTQLKTAKAGARKFQSQLVGRQSVFDNFVAGLKEVMTAVQVDYAKAGENVKISPDRGSGTPLTPSVLMRKYSTGSTRGDENDAPSRRVSQGKEIFTEATTASPLKYGGHPVEHVPATPVSFCAKNTESRSNGHSQLSRILSLTAEYKSSRVQELRGGAGSRPQSSDSVPLRERPGSGASERRRPTGAFSRRNSAR